MQVLKRCNITSYPIARRLPVASFRPHPVDVNVELPGGELEQPAVLRVSFSHFPRYGGKTADPKFDNIFAELRWSKLSSVLSSTLMDYWLHYKIVLL